MPESSSVSTCPYIGLKDDPKTSVGYPSSGNFCHHGKAPAVPKLQHQGAYCLRNTFPECPFYAEGANKRFPRNLRAVVKPLPAQNFSFLRVLAIFVSLFVMLILGWQLRAFFMTIENAGLPSTPTTVMATSTVAATSTIVPTATFSLLFTSPTDLPTQTPQPTTTPALIQKHALDTPIVVDGYQYLIHLVREGEGIDYLIRTYDTTQDVLRSINYLLPPSIWVNLPVVISPGLRDVNLDLPVFQAYKVPMAEIRSGQLAKELGVDSTMLEIYNNCPDGCLFLEGDWLIVPHAR
jgi:hypothetical protein